MLKDLHKNKLITLILPFAFKLYIVWSVLADITLIAGIFWLIFT
jgi:hypothetical protein